VPIKRRHGLFVNRLERNAFELEPNPKVHDRAKMKPRHAGVIPGLDEPLFVVLKKL
jgi:hypothetical protein